MRHCDMPANVANPPVGAGDHEPTGKEYTQCHEIPPCHHSGQRCSTAPLLILQPLQLQDGALNTLSNTKSALLTLSGSDCGQQAVKACVLARRPRKKAK